MLGRSITIAIIFHNLVATGTGAFGVSFADRVLKLDVAHSVPLLGVVAVVAAIVGSLGDGAVLSLLSKRNPAWLVRAPAIALLLTLPISELMGYSSPSRGSFWFRLFSSP